MNASNRAKSFIKSRFPRASALYRNARQALPGPSLEKAFSEIYRTNAWQDNESVSGRGSTLERTKIIRSQLPSLLQELHAESLLDAACGDFNWMQYTNLGATAYVGVEVVPELVRRNRSLYETPRRTFKLIDITRDQLPTADVILCRDCLMHLSFRRIRDTISNFKRSRATYLLCSTHISVIENIDCRDAAGRPLNLMMRPFNFPPPLKLIVEDQELGKCLAVWHLEDL